MHLIVRNDTPYKSLFTVDVYQGSFNYRGFLNGLCLATGKLLDWSESVMVETTQESHFEWEDFEHTL